MILLLLFVMFTIGGSMAYDNAVYGDSTAPIYGTVEASRIMSAGTLDVTYTQETGTGNPFVISNEIGFRSGPWEPGYADAGIVNITTSVPASFAITVDTDGKLPEAEEYALADVIDVYFALGDVTKLGSRVELRSSLNHMGTVREVIENNKAATGTLTPSGDPQPISLVFIMRETAGNHYQGKTLCESGFTVTVTVTETN